MKIKSFFFSLLLSTQIFASPSQWIIIPAESKLTFTATQSGAPVSGEFKTFTGEIFADPNDYKNSKIDILIDVNSLSVTFQLLKETLVTADWFNVSQFPKAEYKATQFEKTGDKTYQAIGTLTIRDISAPVTLTFIAEAAPPNKWIVVGDTVVKRSTFGVGQGEWSSTDEIKDEVKIHFRVVAIKK